MAHHRCLPSIENGAPDALDQLIASAGASFEAGPAWRGDAKLELFESPTEELARLEVREIIGGYCRQVGSPGTAAASSPAAVCRLLKPRPTAGISAAVAGARPPAGDPDRSCRSWTRRPASRYS
jgi:Acetoacetate decarboxylase (ADC)